MILPDKCYDSLVALLLADGMEMTKKLASVSSKKEKPVAEALVKAFEAKNCAVHFVKVRLDFTVPNFLDYYFYRGFQYCYASSVISRKHCVHQVVGHVHEASGNRIPAKDIEGNHRKYCP